MQIGSKMEGDMALHGVPCWYELASTNLGAAQDFYAGLLGWTWADSGMPSMTYLLATGHAAQVAGLYPAEAGQPNAWQVYFAVDNADETATKAVGLGATQIVPPTDIPGTGRFAVLLDPQGAAFAILQPNPDGAGGAYDQVKRGHGNWHDLVTPDPAAAIAFYGEVFGWTVARSVPLGPEMIYHIMAVNGAEFGGAFAVHGPAPFWKPYFSVVSTKAAVAQVVALGGQIMNGPDEVQPDTFTVQIRDPEGVLLALAGPA
jgi:predicted enzyme related to lactoylglutathione lyase